MTSLIKISVIMPVYNSGPYLYQAVQSILTQGLQEIELILIDDGSTDGSSEKCVEWARIDSRVTAIHQKNGGICNARNNAIKISRGEYIAFCDHDDEYLADYLQLAYERAKREDADVVKVEKVSIFLKERSEYKRIYNKLTSLTILPEDISKDFFYLAFNRLLTTAWDGIYKKSFIDKYNIEFDEFYKSGGEDLDFMLKIVRCKPKLCTLPRELYVHYIRMGFSTSSKFDISKIKCYHRLSANIFETMSALNINIKKLQIKYSYFYFLEVIFPLVKILSNPLCPFSLKEKKEIVSELETERGFSPFIKFQNPIAISKYSVKYAFLYYLYSIGAHRINFFLFKHWS
ncbi:glycosyltransferase family 2 protein [Arcticibacter tournemirensis]|uniref:Glycosyltransferase n=1 Tax=Arcticibacter tournemirensis TaxID=699437 RepID=A0A4Q0M896_9SPHI|nr:glycosyltransferase [Arcticibacter tournemirensis]RXF69360.1 glycosyltransferase [Arcticibacter tournemirensis]